MKNMLKIILAAILVMSLAFAFASCDIDDFLGSIFGDDAGDGGDPTDDPKDDPTDDPKDDPTDDPKDDPTDDPVTPVLVSYKVIIKDDAGNPLKSVQVKLLDSEGNRVKTMLTGESGECTFKNIAEGQYSVSLSSISGGLQFLQDEYEFEEGEQTLNIVAYHKIVKTDGQTVYGPGVPDEGAMAYPIGVQSAYVDLTVGKMNYFIFTAADYGKGLYKFSFESTDSNMTIGNYGGPMYVFSDHVATNDSDNEYDGKSFILEITTSYLNTPHVIGIKSSTADSCILHVTRLGDATDGISDMPWSDYQQTVTPEKYYVYDNGKIGDEDMLDITDPDLKVVLGSDGYYHKGTADGPIVFIKLNTASPYIDAISAVVANQMFGWINVDGDKITKISFNALINTYLELCDNNLGVCPLNYDLAKAMQLGGEHMGWWDADHPNYLFAAVNGLQVDNAWLFACCTVSIDRTLGTTEQSPLSLLDKSLVNLEPDTTLYYKATDDVNLVVSDPDGNVQIVYSGTTYTSTDGKIELTLSSSDVIMITLVGASDAVDVTYETK